MMIQLCLKFFEKTVYFLYQQKNARVAKQWSVAKCGLKNIMKKKQVQEIMQQQ